ncbi:hypothetical protein [Sphingomonas qomolangmaensis]|uniref:Lipoprotein n=1 Tax=Sphingomonas qomolangmaensis TaxID=2918765 RepID=A0ABY5LAW2_9SPHN|nr:hypothetical protein [Sphingomonas qomolangmaensis]UUL83168.1 hypothetical protein NMP03_02730 [Sphingomonas qomolangmaensis]
MNAIRIAALAALALPASCAGGVAPGPSPIAAQRGLRIAPEQAVMNAAAVAPAGVSAIFEMQVRNSGRQDGILYLNSEADYRDPRCLTIAIAAPIADALHQRFGTAVDQHLSGKTIAVRGTARRIRIHFYSSGKMTDKYYYQTQVNLKAARHLTVSGE